MHVHEEHRLLSEVVAALMLVWLLASCSPGEEAPTPAVRYSTTNASATDPRPHTVG